MRAAGHDAWSCDLIPSADDSPYHIQGDVVPLLSERWDGVIAFPPCTHLCVSGARWCTDHWVTIKNKPPRWHDGTEKRRQRELGANFFMLFAKLTIPYAIENPIGIMSSRWRKPDQVIQPWQFGHGETKATCLWLNQLPPLVPTDVVSGREARIHKMAPGPNRSKERSRTFSGIANAMASQWFAHSH